MRTWPLRVLMLADPILAREGIGAVAGMPLYTQHISPSGYGSCAAIAGNTVQQQKLCHNDSGPASC